jgi:hypothetical protein
MRVNGNQDTGSPEELFHGEAGIDLSALGIRRFFFCIRWFLQ